MSPSLYKLCKQNKMLLLLSLNSLNELLESFQSLSCIISVYSLILSLMFNLAQKLFIKLQVQFMVEYIRAELEILNQHSGMRGELSEKYSQKGIKSITNPSLSYLCLTI